MKPTAQAGQTFGPWTLKEFIGAGGNGEVWQVSSHQYPVAALKLLRPGRGQKGYDRFHDEITVLLRHPELDGVLPILDHKLPDTLRSETPWYVMPVAGPLSDYLESASANEIVLTFAKLGHSLAAIHANGISHRDIKPANLFYFNQTPCFGDWGLVDYPDKQDVTARFESVGARWTRAPEMERDASVADGPPADVYSLAKSLWIYLTGRKTGFEGQYSPRGTLAISAYHRFNFVDPLDQLLAQATDNDPEMRPSATEFSNTLEEWLAANKDWARFNPLQWKRVLSKLFPNGAPARAIWYTPESIVSVLNVVSSYQSLNHLFLHPTGGNDLVGAKVGREPGTIELDLGITHIVRPKRLYFESFEYGEEWNYFRLESIALQRVLPDEPFRSPYERLVELSSGKHIDFYDWDTYESDDHEQEEEYRHVARHVKSGSFVIFQKHSTYNADSGTYDGRHNEVTAKKFRIYISQQARRIERDRRVRAGNSPT